VMLPRLPRPHANEQMVDRGFRARLGAYLVCLACNQSAVQTFTFGNFFQLAEDKQRHWQLVRLAIARGSLGASAGCDRQQAAKLGSFPPICAMPRGSIESSSTSPAPVASAFRLVAAGHEGMGERHRANTSASKLPMQGGPGMGGSINPVGGSPGPVSPVKVSMSMGLAAGPQEREQANGETLQCGASHLYASPRQGRLATSPMAQAAIQTPLDSKAPQLPASPSEPSATLAMTRTHRGKTTRGRAWCVVCLENPQEMAIDPCGHMSMCEECMKTVKDCPVCRGPIDKTMKIIIAKRHRSGETTEYVSW